MTSTFVENPSESEAPSGFAASLVTRVLKQLLSGGVRGAHARWLEAVAVRVCAQRPDLSRQLIDVLGTEPSGENLLAGLTIGEIGVCYEALLAEVNHASRKSSGQYFTPDDVARFMASQSTSFPTGIWMDPCCGVGNLSWHLASMQRSPSEFVSDQLVLVDKDSIALKCAVALIAAEFLEDEGTNGLTNLWQRSQNRDFLARDPLPSHDYVIANPPYGSVEVRPNFETFRTKEAFSYFLERISKTSSGFIVVTPASYLCAPKFASLRNILNTQMSGGDVFVFDNVPDTLFRGYKYGSLNTSKTNFVRGAITVCSPKRQQWRETPIIRWKSVSRRRMFNSCSALLSDRVVGPNGEWVKLAPSLKNLWDELSGSAVSLADLVSREPTPYRLTVGLTPRYYISAAFRDLERGSKSVLYFHTESSRDLAALVLNSSIPYFWWRALDGGVALSKRVLMTTPIPDGSRVDSRLIEELQVTEQASLTRKLNAGRINENVKRPRHLVEKINKILLGEENDKLSILYSEDMFADATSSTLYK